MCLSSTAILEFLERRDVMSAANLTVIAGSGFHV